MEKQNVSRLHFKRKKNALFILDNLCSKIQICVKNSYSAKFECVGVAELAIKDVLLKC